MDHAGRVERLMEELERPLLVTNLTNIRYLTGFTGSNAFFLATPNGCSFVTDGRYGEVAGLLAAALPETGVEVYTAGMYKQLAAAIGDAASVDLEAPHVSWDFVTKLAATASASLEPSGGVVERHRLTKDHNEVAALRAAAAVGDAAFSQLSELVSAAGTEGELGDALVDCMKRGGGEPAGWPPIVAVDANAARPHHRSGTGDLGGGLLLLDYGCTSDGYHSDMTRTVLFGPAPDRDVERVYRAVAEANEAGIDAVEPGVIAGDVDAACRTVLADYGYEEHFVHSTGHGVGLDIHEAPSLRKGSSDVLEPGQVLTVEPGVYLPGRFGVRIEDMVLVTESGSDVLTKSSKELIST